MVLVAEGVILNLLFLEVALLTNYLSLSERTLSIGVNVKLAQNKVDRRWGGRPCLVRAVFICSPTDNY